MGKGTPMTPVLAIRTVSEGIPKCNEVKFVISRASFIPCPPTQALAQPEFTTTACALCLAIRILDSLTGADFIRLVVKTPAAVQATSEYKMARSGILSFLIPALTAPAKNPIGEVTFPDGIRLYMEYLSRELARLV
jgi:hypothetical protein